MSEVTRQQTVTEEIAHLRPDPGDILLFHHPERFRSRLIAWFTRSPFYHVALYAGEGQVIEARIPAVMRRDLFTQKDGYRFVVLRAPERAAAMAAVAWAERQVGAPYDLHNLVRLVFSRLLHLPSLCRCSCDERFICGNFIVRAYAEAGIDLFPGRDASAIVPADFLSLLRRQRRGVRWWERTGVAAAPEMGRNIGGAANVW